MSAFEKLLGELTAAQTEQNDLTKSLTATGEGEGGAGSEGGTEGGKDGGEGAAGGAEGAKEGGEGAALTKAFKVKLENGEEVDAIDGEKLIKSLQDRVEAGEKQTGEVVTQLVTLVKGQNALIKSLSEQVQALGASGRGRRTVISVTEKAPLAKGGASAHGGNGGTEEVSIEDFMAKSNDAFENKRISGVELTTIDVARRSGTAIDPNLIKKVLGGGK